MKMDELYATNQDFKGYVDRYMKSNHITKEEEALKHALVLEYALYDYFTTGAQERNKVCDNTIIADFRNVET